VSAAGATVRGLQRSERQPVRHLPSSIIAITAPTLTVSPSLTKLRAHHAGGRRRHFDRNLVGFKAGDRLVERQPLRPAFSAIGRAWLR
jgi:hypothetical protein